MLKSQFSDYLNRTNVKGSGKVSSYLRAIDLVAEMIAKQPVSFSDCSDIWNTTSVERLQDLYEFTVAEKLEGSKSV